MDINRHHASPILKASMMGVLTLLLATPETTLAGPDAPDSQRADSQRGASDHESHRRQRGRYSREGRDTEKFSFEEQDTLRRRRPSEPWPESQTPAWDSQEPTFFTEVPGEFGPLEARLTLHYGSFNAKVEKETVAGSGNEIRLHRHLDLDRTEWLPRLDLSGRVARDWELELSYMAVSHRGDATLPETIRLGGDVIGAGQAVRTKNQLHDLGFGARLLMIDSADLQVRVPLGLRYIHNEITIKSAAGNRANETTEALIPFTGLEASFQPTHWLSLGAGVRLGASTYHDGKDLMGFAELSLNAAVVWEDRIRVGAGYEFLTVDIEQGHNADEQLDFELGGPSLFVEARF